MLAAVAVVAWPVFVAHGQEPGALPPAAMAAADALSLEEFVPGDALACLIVREPDARLGEMRSLLDAYGYERSAVRKMLSMEPGIVQAKVGLLGFAALTGLDLWSAAAALLGREALVALVPGETPEQPHYVAVTLPRDAETAERVIDAALAFAVQGGKREADDPSEAHATPDDEAIHSLSPEFHLARVGEAVAFSNAETPLRALLARRVGDARDANEAVGPNARLREAGAAATPDALAFGFFDLDRLRTASEDEDGVSAEAFSGLLFGGLAENLRTANMATFAVARRENGLEWRAASASAVPLPESHRGFIQAGMGAAVVAERDGVEEGDRPTWSVAALPGFLGAFTVERDWAALFADRESFLALPAASQLVEFANTMTTIMGGLDYVDEYLPAIDGSVRFVAARQHFDDLWYLPTPVLPAFAWITPVKTEETGGEFARRLYSGSQIALSIATLDMAQKGQPTYLLDVDRYKDHRIITTAYPESAYAGAMSMEPAAAVGDGSKTGVIAATADDATAMTPENGIRGADGEVAAGGGEAGPRRVGAQFNFAPAAAVVGDQFIVTTSAQLLRDIVDAIEAGVPDGRDATKAGDTFVLRGDASQALLLDNYEALVADTMLKKDKPRAAAKRDVDALIEIVGWIDRFEASLSLDEREAALTVSLTLVPPSEVSSRQSEAAGETPAIDGGPVEDDGP